MLSERLKQIFVIKYFLCQLIGSHTFASSPCDVRGEGRNHCLSRIQGDQGYFPKDLNTALGCSYRRFENETLIKHIRYSCYPLAKKLSSF